jgi:hypothetical protein
MKLGIFIALLVAVSPAWSQPQESFNSYVGGLPAATSAGPTDQFYIRQGGSGASRQTTLLGNANTWSGIQSFNGGITVPTQATGNNTTAAASTAFVAAAARAKLVAPTNFFVNTSGNDSNTCLAPGTSACATIQGAINKIYSIDAAGQAIGISCAASQVFTGAINLYGPVLNPAFPAPITLNCNNSTINVTGNNAIQVGQGAYLQIINTMLQTTTSGNCLEAYQNGQIFLSGGVVFNGCAGFDMEMFSQGYIVEAVTSTYSGTSLGHAHITTGGVYNHTAAVTVNNPAWTDWFLGCSQATATFSGSTFTGSATGQRYLAHKACSIDTGVDPTMVQPETFLPGSTVGVVDASSAYLPYKVPTVSSCGTTPSVASTATDWSGQLTVGTGNPTTCNIVFNAAKTTTPNCTVVNDGQVPLSSFGFVTSTTGIATSFGAASGATLHWTCTPTGV